MGVSNAELWNNVGLCCFYAGQYDMALSCFERALSMAGDDIMADIWYAHVSIITQHVAHTLRLACRYNIGHIGVALGDLGLAYQAFKVAVSIDPNHGEALNNIAVLEMRRNKFEIARACLTTSMSVANHLFEPIYNSCKWLSYSICYRR
jgi:tetratricopeptide repeat protein 8